MGKSTRRRLRYCFILVCMLIQNSGFAQAVVQGLVTDGSKPIVSANVIAMDSTQTIIAFDYTDDKGNYKLKIDKKKALTVTVTALGYVPKTTDLRFTVNKFKANVNVALQKKSIDLDEVIIQADLPMRIDGDTVSFKTKFYTTGTEQTVEQLLKTIPGIAISADGTIRVRQQEIGKLLVDGDDFFGKGYKVLSKNMPAYPIEEVQVFNNYSDNPLLKNIEESNEVVLNLKLGNQYKRIWFGHVNAGVGRDNFYQLKANLMNFGQKNKYYFLTNLNTIGVDAIGDIENLIAPAELDNNADIGEGQEAHTLLNLTPDYLRLKRSKTHFNNAKLVSLNAIFSPSDNLKIKAMGFFNWDKTDFFRTSLTQVETHDAGFLNTEKYNLQQKKKIAFGKIDLTYKIAKNQILEATTQYSRGDFQDHSSLLFNNLPTTENLKHQSDRFDQKTVYTYKLDKRKALLITGRFINEDKPQAYAVDKFVLYDLFPQYDSVNRVKQNSVNTMWFAGINAHFMNRYSNGNLFELQLGNAFRKDELLTDFTLYNDNKRVGMPEDYQNNVGYQVNDLFVKSKYRLEVGAVGITGNLSVHQIVNRLKNTNSKLATQTPFYVVPKLKLDWQINTAHKVTASYSYNTTNVGILEVYDGFVLTDFRTFSKGIGGNDQLMSSRLLFRYQLGNWSDRFFINTYLIYNRDYDFLSVDRVVKQNYILSRKVAVKNRTFLAANTEADYYFKRLQSNLKLNLGYTKNTFKTRVNASPLQEVTAVNYTYGIELRSNFDGIFNYHLGTKWTTSRVKMDNSKRYTDNFSFLDLYFSFSDKWTAKLKAEHYYLGGIEVDKSYPFLDVEVRYVLIKDKLAIGISGKNLWNTNSFARFSISNIAHTLTTYRLLPRIALLKLDYRF